MFDLAGTVHSSGALANEIVRLLEQLEAVDTSAILVAAHGKWTEIANAGRKLTPPLELAAEALDSEQIAVAAPWTAAPLTPGPDPEDGRRVLLVAGQLPLASVATIATAVDRVWQIVRDRAATARRTRRLETILSIIQQWHQAEEIETLLEKMAEAATALLNSDRASIFLWDEATRTLVGRPALGIEGGELRVSDQAGVVGHVFQTGEPRRVDTTGEQSAIDRRVDSETGYRTDTVLCVPLISSRGKRIGAFEVLNKREGNYTRDDERGLTELAAHAAIAIENTQHFERLIHRQKQLVDEAAGQIELLGTAPPLEAIRSTVGRVAETDLSVLMLGENGTGKDVVARSIHYLSRRRDEPFVAINCAAITETLLESELFGHERGAFTDAHEARAGKFELASGGTLFLDEIGEMSPGGQAKLLRVLEEKIVVRVGGSIPIKTDTRVLAATNQDLAALVRDKKFRQDLYYRLNVVTIELPPLRDRGEDVILLGEHFLDGFCQAQGRATPRLSAAARKRLLSHHWPGNVRELRNLMERLAYLTTGSTIGAEDLAFIAAPQDHALSLFDTDEPLADASRRFQVEYIRRMVQRSGGNMSLAAERLGLHRSNLYRKMRQLEMTTDEPNTQ